MLNKLYYYQKETIKHIKKNDVIFISLPTGSGITYLLSKYLEYNNVTSAFLGHRIIFEQDFKNHSDFYAIYNIQSINNIKGKSYDVIILDINKKSIFIFELLYFLYLNYGKKIIIIDHTNKISDDFFKKNNDLCDYSFYHKKCMKTIDRIHINNFFNSINVKIIDKIYTLAEDRKKKMIRIIN